MLVEKTCGYCNGSGEGYYPGGTCQHCDDGVVFVEEKREKGWYWLSSESGKQIGYFDGEVWSLNECEDIFDEAEITVRCGFTIGPKIEEPKDDAIAKAEGRTE